MKRAANAFDLPHLLHSKSRANDSIDGSGTNGSGGIDESGIERGGTQRTRFFSSPRTQMTAVKQKLLPGIYFSPENVPFAQKKGIKKCSGKTSNQKVILVYQPSTRMYTRIPAYGLYQFGHARHANLVYFRSNEINHQRTHVAAVDFIVSVMTTAGSTPARIIGTTISHGISFSSSNFIESNNRPPLLATSASSASVSPYIYARR